MRLLLMASLMAVSAFFMSSCATTSQDADFSVEEFLSNMEGQGLRVTDRHLPRAQRMMGPGARQRFLDVGPVGLVAFTFADHRIAKRAAGAISRDGYYVPKVSKDGEILNGAEFDAVSTPWWYRKGPVIILAWVPGRTDDPKRQAMPIMKKVDSVMGAPIAGR